MLSMEWRILDTGARSGAYNMALDAAMLAEVESGASPPTLRVYGWSPACISLGHNQRPDGELDLAAVRALGFDVVVRPTGGRAVLHVDELTYSVIAPPGAEPWCGTLSESYRAISRAVAEALGREGFGLTLDRGYPVEKPHALRAMTPCFSSTARSEVVHGERKVVGSAQRRYRGAFLQHGSILVTEGHRRIVDCLRLEPGRRREYLEVLDRNAASLEAIHGHRPDWRDLARGFLPRMAEALGVAFRPGAVTEREAARAEAVLAAASGVAAKATAVPAAAASAAGPETSGGADSPGTRKEAAHARGP